MPVNNFTVGRDVTLTVMTSKGQLTFAGLTDFTADPVTTDLKSKRFNGRVVHGIIPDGWKGSFKLDRVDSTVDDWWAQLEADYFNGVNQTSGTILETIQEASGAVTQWRYTGVILKLEKGGDKGGDKKTEQTVGFTADGRDKVA